MNLKGLLFLPLFASSFAKAAESVNSEILKIDVPSATSKISLDPLKPSKWTYSFDSEFYLNQQEQKDKGGDTPLTSYHVVGLNYKYDSSTVLKIAPTFDVNYVPVEKERAENVQDEIQNKKTFSGSRMSDPFIAYNKEHGNLWGSDIISTEIRYYIPVSNVSRELNSVGQLSLDITVPWVIHNWTLSYNVNPNIQLESEALSDHPSTFNFNQNAKASYDFPNDLSSYVMFGNHLCSASKDFLHNDQTEYAFEIGAAKNFTKDISITLNLNNTFEDGKEEFRLLAADKNNFTLSTSLNF